ncbi:hypothetical protein GPALN_015642 [Globodera pallida]|nr:hypothetical protein GPALN_015642 [Globodera pallida]
MSNNDNKRLEKKSRSKSRRRSSTRGDASRERRGDSSRVRRGDALRERNDLLAQQQADVFRTSRIDASDPRVQNRRLLLLALRRGRLPTETFADPNSRGAEIAARGLYAKTGPPKPKQDLQDWPWPCHRCGERHFVKNCPKAAANPRCFKCHGLGHMAAACPMVKMPPPSRHDRGIPMPAPTKQPGPAPHR